MHKNSFKMVCFLFVSWSLLINCTNKNKEETAHLQPEIQNEIQEKDDNTPLSVETVSEDDAWKLKSLYFVPQENIEIPGEDSSTKIVEKFLQYLQSTDAFYFGDDLEYLAKCSADIDPMEEITWFASYRINDNMPTIYNWLYVLKFKEDHIKVCRVYSNPTQQNKYYVEDDLGYKLRQFPILSNLDGQFYPTAWLYDVNGDGFDEVIAVHDHPNDDTKYSTIELRIVGYDRNKERFVTYLDIETIILNEETGPEPIQYVQDQGIWGFKCLVNESAWSFFTWDMDLKKYVEKELVG
ncbi:hypothetical protein AGMMS49579_18710 [Spirochaetia bacterium]|nr:hypothetical protein AGMMS49579_18710 [Spirochaetia bacterium]